MMNKGYRYETIKRMMEESETWMNPKMIEFDLFLFNEGKLREAAHKHFGSRIVEKDELGAAQGVRLHRLRAACQDRLRRRRLQSHGIRART
ncbi:MAG: hypothetical protein MZU97_06865 [Bacillus subtilis]|nr:hypothetical protein [Bacillus subtilis]